MNINVEKVIVTVIQKYTVKTNLGIPLEKVNSFTKGDAPLKHEITERHLGP